MNTQCIHNVQGWVCRVLMSCTMYTQCIHNVHTRACSTHYLYFQGILSVPVFQGPYVSVSCLHPVHTA